MGVLTQKEYEELQRKTAEVTSPAVISKQIKGEQVHKPEKIFTYFHPEQRDHDPINMELNVEGKIVRIIDGIVRTTDESIKAFLDRTGYVFVKEDKVNE